MSFDGGPAFPLAVDCSGGSRTEYQIGMSLRDWFAGMALSGLIPKDYSSGPCNAAAAERCYAIADAMLAARKAK